MRAAGARPGRVRRARLAHGGAARRGAVPVRRRRVLGGAPRAAPRLALPSVQAWRQARVVFFFFFFNHQVRFLIGCCVRRL